MNKIIESAKNEAVFDITKALTAYEKFILAGIDFQKLCNNEDDFKDYLYTNQDYENNKPVSLLFISAVQDSEVVRKDTKSFIKEVIKASELEQTDPKLISGFRKLKDSWNAFLTELKTIPNEVKPKLVDYLKKYGKANSSTSENFTRYAEEFKLYESLWDDEIVLTEVEEKLIYLFWDGIRDYSSETWFNSSTNEKEEILWWALNQLEEPINRERAIELFWDWADGLEEDSFIDF